MRISNVSSLLRTALFIILPALSIGSAQRVDHPHQAKPEPASQDKPAAILRLSALDLAFNAGMSASSLESVEDGVETQAEAARLLIEERPESARRLLELSLTALKRWVETAKGEEATSRLRRTSALRGTVLALYSKLDAEGAKKLGDSWLNSKKGKLDVLSSPQTAASLTTPERVRANELAQGALAALDRDPPQAIKVALSSVTSTAKVSAVLASMTRTLVEKHNRPLLASLEYELSGVIAELTSDDPMDYSAVIAIIRSDAEMDKSSRSRLLAFLLRSLKQVRATVTEARSGSTEPAMSGDALGYMYSIFLRDVMPIVRTYEPSLLDTLEELVAFLRSQVPPAWAERVYNSYTDDSAAQQLERALSTPPGETRESRLTTLALRSLGGSIAGVKGRQMEAARKAIEAMSESVVKRVFLDYYTIAESEQFLKQGRIPEAIDRAHRISKKEWQARVALGIAGVQAERHMADSHQLYEDAFQIIDASPPSWSKVQLAFFEAEALVSVDRLRAFEVLQAAATFSLQMHEKREDDTGVVVPVSGFYAAFGKVNFGPEDQFSKASDIVFGPGIGDLAREDWIRTDLIGRGIGHLQVRLRFQLAMCEGVLGQGMRAKGENAAEVSHNHKL